MLGHQPHRVAAAEEDAERIGIHHESPVGLGRVGDRAGAAGPGIVDQDPEPAEARIERRQRGHPVVVASYVEPMIDGAFAELLLQITARVVEIGGHYSRAFRDEALYDRTADAAQAARHQRDFAFQPSHAISVG
jgi:hypothetical protein